MNYALYCLKSFTDLPKEKQEQIINAGISVFSRYEYKKASVNDIAVEAGIAKSMVFHYFGSKKNLYLYLVSFAGQELVDQMEKNIDKTVLDFFDRIKMLTSIKIALLHRHPFLTQFFVMVYREKDEQVASELHGFFASGEKFRASMVLENIETYKFKQGINPETVMKLLIRYSEGYVSELPSDREFDLEQVMAEFDECLSLLKNNFYKEEYLQPHN